MLTERKRSAKCSPSPFFPPRKTFPPRKLAPENLLHRKLLPLSKSVAKKTGGETLPGTTLPEKLSPENYLYPSRPEKLV